MFQKKKNNSTMNFPWTVIAFLTVLIGIIFGVWSWIIIGVVLFIIYLSAISNTHNESINNKKEIIDDEYFSDDDMILSSFNNPNDKLP